MCKPGKSQKEGQEDLGDPKTLGGELHSTALLPLSGPAGLPAGSFLAIVSDKHLESSGYDKHLE